MEIENVSLLFMNNMTKLKKENRRHFFNATGLSNPDGWPCDGAVHISNSPGGRCQEFGKTE